MEIIADLLSRAILEGSWAVNTAVSAFKILLYINALANYVLCNVLY